LLQEACRKLDILGTGASWKMRVSDGLIHHAVQSTWAQIMRAPGPCPPRAHLSPTRSEEPKGGRHSLKFGVAGSSCSAEDMQAAETRIRELRAKLLEQQARQLALDRHKPLSHADRNVKVRQMHIGTKGKAPPASRDRRWRSDAADDLPMREDSEAQAAAAADAMVASLRREIRRAASDEADSAGYRTESCPEHQIQSPESCPEHQIHSPVSVQSNPASPPDEHEPTEEQPALHEAVQHAQERQASSIEEENTSPARVFPEASDHDDETLADESESAEEQHDSDMLAVPSAPSVVEEPSSAPASLEASPQTLPPSHLADIPEPPSKRSFARPLRRGSTSTSAPHCSPVADAAKDDEDSDEWAEDQLGDRLRTCFDGRSSGTSHRIDLN